MLSNLHLFLLEELKILMQAHGLTWDRTCCSKMFEGRQRDHGTVIARSNSNIRSSCWIRTMILVNGSWVIEPCADYWKLLPRPVICNEVLPQLSYVDTLPPVSNFFKLMRKGWAVVSIEAQIFFLSGKLLPVGSLHFCRAIAVVEPFEQIRRRNDADKLKDILLLQIRDLEKQVNARFDEHDRAYRALLTNIRKDMHDHKTALSLDVVKSQHRISTQVAAAAFDNVDVRMEVKELNSKVTDLDEQFATIRSELLDFRAKAEENHNTLSTQLGFLVDYINRGDVEAFIRYNQLLRSTQMDYTRQFTIKGKCSGANDEPIQTLSMFKLERINGED
ncbi:hypothetical protein F511_37068 [Dorcoceras hygrometricum]|uniref:Uncharacterized protein n=1 Tax=Dorcoceras hygrometricum TaxID=472368 RepID=A0A2Z7ABF9_9LAMI|nr:hypothetical protein F511_37068 [Dorcoceras hygrometricum]